MVRFFMHTALILLSQNLKKHLNIAVLMYLCRKHSRVLRCEGQGGLAREMRVCPLVAQ